MPPQSRYWSLALLTPATHVALSLSPELSGPQMPYSAGRKVDRQPWRSPASWHSVGLRAMNGHLWPLSQAVAHCVLCPLSSSRKAECEGEMHSLCFQSGFSIPSPPASSSLYYFRTWTIDLLGPELRACAWACQRQLETKGHIL